jgi:hypothetical protein
LVDQVVKGVVQLPVCRQDALGAVRGVDHPLASSTSARYFKRSKPKRPRKLNHMAQRCVSLVAAKPTNSEHEMPPFPQPLSTAHFPPRRFHKPIHSRPDQQLPAKHPYFTRLQPCGMLHSSVSIKNRCKPEKSDRKSNGRMEARQNSAGRGRERKLADCR